MFNRKPLILMIGLMCASCSAPGTLVAREDPNQIPSVVATPEAGKYGLFVVGETDPIFSFVLGKSEKIGFEQSAAGVVGDVQVEVVYAVAGQNRFPLEISKAYEWRKE
jgi:hypothetical protein